MEKQLKDYLLDDGIRDKAFSPIEKPMDIYQVVDIDFHNFTPCLVVRTPGETDTKKYRHLDLSLRLHDKEVILERNAQSLPKCTTSPKN